MAKAIVTPEWKRLIERCQSLWEAYDKAPTKKRLEAFGAYIEKMKASKSVKVKAERTRATRAFNAEWKRQGYKSPTSKKKVTKKKAKKTTRRRKNPPDGLTLSDITIGDRISVIFRAQNMKPIWYDATISDIDQAVIKMDFDDSRLGEDVYEWYQPEPEPAYWRRFPSDEFGAWAEIKRASSANPKPSKSAKRKVAKKKATRRKKNPRRARGPWSEEDSRRLYGSLSGSAKARYGTGEQEETRQGLIRRMSVEAKGYLHGEEVDWDREAMIQYALRPDSVSAFLGRKVFEKSFDDGSMKGMGEVYYRVGVEDGVIDESGDIIDEPRQAGSIQDLRKGQVINGWELWGGAEVTRYHGWDDDAETYLVFGRSKNGEEYELQLSDAGYEGKEARLEMRKPSFKDIDTLWWTSYAYGQAYAGALPEDADRITRWANDKIGLEPNPRRKNAKRKSARKKAPAKRKSARKNVKKVAKKNPSGWEMRPHTGEADIEDYFKDEWVVVIEGDASRGTRSLPTAGPFGSGSVSLFRQPYRPRTSVAVDKTYVSTTGSGARSDLGLDWAERVIAREGNPKPRKNARKKAPAKKKTTRRKKNPGLTEVFSSTSDPAKYLQSYRVTGSGRFPVDMLRYDESWVDSGDHLGPEHRSTKVFRHVPVKTDRYHPTVDRWASMGWEVSDVEYEKLDIPLKYREHFRISGPVAWGDWGMAQLKSWPVSSRDIEKMAGGGAVFARYIAKKTDTLQQSDMPSDFEGDQLELTPYYEYNPKTRKNARKKAPAKRKTTRKKNASQRLASGAKTKINMDLIAAGFDGNGRFKNMTQALSSMKGVLADHGIEEAEVFSSDRFRYPSGQTSFRIAFTNKEDLFSPVDITNSSVSWQWHKKDDGRYEVVAYLG